MVNGKIKGYLPFLLLLLVIGLLSACTSHEAAEGMEKYELKVEEVKYKGYLLPVQMKRFTLDESQLIVNDGDSVFAGDLLTKADEKVKAEISKLIKKRQQYAADLRAIEKEIVQISRGKYSINPELSAEIETLRESITSQEYVIQELELNLGEIDDNYVIEKDRYERNLQQNQADIERLIEQQEQLQSSEEEPEAATEEKIISIENEIDLLERENRDLEAELSALKKSYEFNRKRTEQSLQNAREKKKSYEKKYERIVKGNTSDPSVRGVLSHLEDERKILKDTIEELSDEITAYEEESVIAAPFDGKIAVRDGQVILFATEYQFIFDAKENQVEELTELNNLQLVYKSEKIGQLSFHSLKYNEDLSIQGQVPVYSMTFDIEATVDFEPMYKATAYLVYEKGVTVPDEYLGKDGNTYYVIIDGKKKHVEIEKHDRQKFLVKGAKPGDVLEKVVNG